MNKEFKLFFVLLSLLTIGNSLNAEQKTEVYNGFYGGKSCQVTINWANYSGQGEVDGNIVVENGAVLRFFGTNPRSGYMEISIQGQQHTLQKTKTNSSISWTGNLLSFSRSTGAGMPAGGGTTFPPIGTAQITKQYTGFFRGKECTANLNWTAEECNGTMIVERDMAYALDGGVIDGRLLELEITTEPILHKLEKSTVGGRISWVGDYMSLSESAPATPSGILGGGGLTGGGVINTPTGILSGGTNKPIGGGIMNTPTGILSGGTTPTLGGGSITTGGPNLGSGSVWVIACEAEETEAAARAAMARWQSRGFTANVLWIPDYSSLSGARLWLVHVGSYNYADKTSAMQMLKNVKTHYSDAYGIKVDQSGKRETF